MLFAGLFSMVTSNTAAGSKNAKIDQNKDETKRKFTSAYVYIVDRDLTSSTPI